METRLCWCRCVSRERANSAFRCQQCTACSQTVRRAKVTVLSRWSATDDATGGAQIGHYLCRPCVWHDPTRGGVDVCACPHPPTPARISREGHGRQTLGHRRAMAGGPPPPADGAALDASLASLALRITLRPAPAYMYSTHAERDGGTVVAIVALSTTPWRRRWWHNVRQQE